MPHAIVGSLCLVKSVLALLLVFAAATAVPVSAQVVDAGLPLGNEADPYAPAIARMVQLFARYTAWPGDQSSSQRPHLNTCIVGPSDHADDLAQTKTAFGRTIRPVRMAPAAVSADSCDIVYLGRMSIAQQRQITASLLYSPVLTIAENDPACRGRSMVCLLFEADSLSFRLNIDAVSRSKVRIDPRVLRMGMGDRK